MGRWVVGTLEPERPKHWMARPRGLLDGRLQIWQKSVAKLDRPTTTRRRRLPEGPRLLRGRSFRRIVPGEGVQRSQLRPADQQLRGAAPEEPPDVRACQSDAGQTQIQELRQRHFEVFPAAPVVARPDDRVALDAGRSGTRQEERSLAGTCCSEALAGGAVFNER